MPNDDPTASTVPASTVLCIEDDATSMAVVEAMLSLYPSITLLTAFSAREGLQLADTRAPDLVLLDMLLPDLSGVEVVRALSERISKRELRVVLLTGEPFSLDVAKAMSLGAHEYWPKPLTRERVASGLQRVLGGRAGARADASSNTRGRAP